MVANELERVKDITDSSGRFNRVRSTFRDKVEVGGEFPPERGRYHLYVAYACPWAHRTLITCRLKGLEDIIGLTIVSPRWGDQGWPLAGADPYPGCEPDPSSVNAQYVKDLYMKANPSYEGRYTVPVLWDLKKETIVNNESAEIVRIFNEGFNSLLGEEVEGESKANGEAEANGKDGRKEREEKGKKVDVYPEELREGIDEINGWIYEHISNGVYKCGIAKSQEAYDEAIVPLFDSLDKVEKILASDGGRQYLMGEKLTEADVRLYPTIVRFDPVYVGHFKCNVKTIRDGYPNIHRWLRKLYWTNDAFKGTTDFDHIKVHYYWALTFINPSRVVPRGPIPNICPL